MTQPLSLNINSEIGELEGVILHTPGAEVENMTPGTAQRALYSDILNLSIAQKEYAQLRGVLERYTRTYEVVDLLSGVLDNYRKRESLIGKICIGEGAADYFDDLMEMPSVELAKALIEGVPAKINSLTAYLNDEYYALYPLYNFYFTRDASVTIGKHDFHPENGEIFMEGGDILIARDDILLVGNGNRTSTQGIDLLIARLCKDNLEGRKHVIVQQLPHSPESFIHLDMVFTLLDRDKCMVFEPLILGNNQYRTVQITIENGKVAKIKSVSDILSALKRLGMELEPVFCGGVADEWNQEREQWHSGANFFAMAPGKVLSYARNIHTLDELSKHGFEIIQAWDIIENRKDMKDYRKCVVTIDGSELPRGGGGARCMTMPVSRKNL